MPETNKDKNKQNKDESILSEIDFKAMELRFYGLTYEQIAEQLFGTYGANAPSAQVLRTKFSRKGILHSFYKDYVKEQIKIRREDSLNLFHAHLDKAVKVLLDIMGNAKQHTPSRVKAAIEIINRELGEPKKVIQAEISNPAREILEGAGIILDDGEKTE